MVENHVSLYLIRLERKVRRVRQVETQAEAPPHSGSNILVHLRLISQHTCPATQVAGAPLHNKCYQIMHGFAHSARPLIVI